MPVNILPKSLPLPFIVLLFSSSRRQYFLIENTLFGNSIERNMTEEKRSVCESGILVVPNIST